MTSLRAILREKRKRLDGKRVLVRYMRRWPGKAPHDVVLEGIVVTAREGRITVRIPRGGGGRVSDYGVIFDKIANEGVTWARGWNTAAAKALRTAVALSTTP